MVADKRILLMGTPEFAVKPFLALVNAGYKIIGLVSQPDRKVGRKQVLTPTPTKVFANQNNIKVYQVEKIKDDFNFILQLKPDLIITCAYGQIIPKEIIDFPPLGCINIHGSILPKYRGGAPIHHALLNGEIETGISIMKMAVKMDAGDVYSVRKINIEENDTYDSLANKLSNLAAEAIIKDLPMIIEGKLKSVKQNENLVTFGYNIKPEQEHLDWNKKVEEVHNHIRGLSSHPGASSLLDGNIVKFYSGEKTSIKSTKSPGSIVGFDHGIIVATKDYNYRLLELQLAGKKRMSANEVINGFKQKFINQAFK